MPMYDYQCGNCKTTREYYVPLANQNPSKCDDCGFGRLERTAVQGFAVGGETKKSSKRPRCVSATHIISTPNISVIIKATPISRPDYSSN